MVSLLPCMGTNNPTCIDDTIRLGIGPKGEKTTSFWQSLFDFPEIGELDGYLLGLERTSQMPFVKSAGGIIYNGSDIVLVEQRNGTITFPKGRKEIGEFGALDTAWREIEEETGIPKENLIYLHTFPPHQRVNTARNAIKIITYAVFMTEQRELVPKDQEVQQAFWVPKEKVSWYLTNPADKEFFETQVQRNFTYAMMKKPAPAVRETVREMAKERTYN